ncbi:MAG: hypothetical protein ACI8XB_003076 [Patiriisocius sp.]|jgi:hypothetical protein
MFGVSNAHPFALKGAITLSLLFHSENDQNQKIRETLCAGNPFRGLRGSAKEENGYVSIRTIPDNQT